jgi:hypothetical protein
MDFQWVLTVIAGGTTVVLVVGWSFRFLIGMQPNSRCLKRKASMDSWLRIFIRVSPKEWIILPVEGKSSQWDWVGGKTGGPYALDHTRGIHI